MSRADRHARSSTPTSSTRACSTSSWVASPDACACSSCSGARSCSPRSSVPVLPSSQARRGDHWASEQPLLGAIDKLTSHLSGQDEARLPNRESDEAAIPARTLAPSKEALDAPLNPPPLDDKPGQASAPASPSRMAWRRQATSPLPNSATPPLIPPRSPDHQRCAAPEGRGIGLARASRWERARRRSSASPHQDLPQWIADAENTAS